jgi:hypothetical protein
MWRNGFGRGFALVVKTGCTLDKQFWQKGLASEEPNKAGVRAENFSRFIIKVLLAECAFSDAVRKSREQASGK